jgi:hypothetical protein
MLALAALLLAAAPAPATASIAGFYRTSQMEIGAALELKKNGHFRYQLDYGAVSESASGVWTFDGKAVHLTTRPMPKAPSFELVHDDAAPKGELYMTVDSPGLEWGHPLEAVATADMKKGFEVSADDTGRVDLTGRPPIAAIAPLMPVYGSTGQIFQLDRERGHRLQFRFRSNDLGTAAFKNEPLIRDGRNLILSRYDTRIRFIRVRP